MSKSIRILAAILVIATATFPAVGADDSHIEFRPLIPDLRLTFTKPISVAIHSDAEFKALCERAERQHGRDARCEQPSSGIAFTTQTLLVVALGGTDIGDFSARSVSETGSSIIVDATRERFGRECTVITIMAFPKLAILVRATSKPLAVTITPLVRDCVK